MEVNELQTTSIRTLQGAPGEYGRLWVKKGKTHALFIVFSLD